MAPSRRPIVDLFGCTWLGDPEGRSCSIEIADDFIGFYEDADEVRIRWDDIAHLEVDIPTSRWPWPKVSYWALSFMDMAEAVEAPTRSTTPSATGYTDIDVRVTTKDGATVVGRARKHQAFGYPKPEAEAARAILLGRVDGSTG